MADTNPGNFANRPKEEVLAAASKGGKASSTATESAPDDSGTGKQGFASMDPERVREIASMGGKAAAASRAEGSPDEDETGKQGFASMDPERQNGWVSKTVWTCPCARASVCCFILVLRVMFPYPTRDGSSDAHEWHLRPHKPRL
ncbi:hypothetical protein RB594_007991 [Gaeumannomyces avenae]